MHRLAWTLPVLAAILSGCSLVPSASQPTASTPASQASASTGASATHSAAVTAKDPAGSPAPASSRNPTALPTLPDAKGGGPGRFPPTGHGRLDGKVILVDPGHNGGNFAAASVINRLIWNGRESETCDTTGAETDAGYTEALFIGASRCTWPYLRAAGATVVLTRTFDTEVRPCVLERAAVGNEVHANVAVSIHADGGPPGGRGFAILEPVADGINNAIVRPLGRSRRRPPRGVRRRDRRARQLLRRRRRHPTPRRPGRGQPVHRPQGVHRVRQHAQYRRRRPGDVRALAGPGRPRDHRRPDRLRALRR